MTQLSPETIWHMNEKQLLNTLDESSFLPRSKKIRFYAPSFMYYKTCYYCSSSSNFPTISVTGNGCALKCKHCGGKVLETMHPATTPEELFRLCRKLKDDGAKGCLISGGCLPDGSVPLQRFTDSIRKVKRELRLTVFVHTGVTDRETAEKLAEAEVDAALIDVIGSDETMREIYNLKVTVQDYADSLKALNEANVAFVPHVVVGLHYGELKGELHALEIISRYKPSALVVIALMPIHGTEMEKVEPPKPADVAKVLLTARLMFPQTPLVLGCMRPKSKHRAETDVLAIKAGADAVAFPAEEAVRFAQNEGYETSFSPFCCSQIYMDLKGSAVSENRTL